MPEILDNIYSVGVQNPTLEVFDIIMKTPHGTSYNAYLVRGESKSALVETAKDGFLDAYLKNVEAVMPFSAVDYLIVNHTEPDHAGVIPMLLEKNPKLEIIGTASAINFIGQIINQPFKGRAVKKGDSLDLGGRELRFYPMPNLHWPDTMFTFDTRTRALFTCDFLGAHYSFPELLMSRVRDKDGYLEAVKQYYLDIMSPFAQPFVQNGVNSVRELNPSMVLTGHGAALDTQIAEICDLYEALARKPQGDTKSVAIVYVSAYGYTRALAEAVAQEVSAAGLKAELLELDETTRARAFEIIEAADGVLLGTPTFLGYMLQPVGELLAALHPCSLKGKVCSAFGSYGWSGEGVPNVIGRLEQLKARTVEGYRVRLKPSPEELEGARAFARNFLSAL